MWSDYVDIYIIALLVVMVGEKTFYISNNIFYFKENMQAGKRNF